MVFVITQIKCGVKVVKLWYGCVIVDSCTLSDLYYEFSGGKLDGSVPLLDEYFGATVEAFAGKSKTDLIRVNSQCCVGDVTFSLGQYVEFCLAILDTAGSDSTMIQSSSAKESAFDLLIRGSREKLHLPRKWRADAPVNKKLEFKNEMIDWLEKNKLGWEASHAQQQGGFNKPENRKKRKIDHTNLFGSHLQAHSLSLFYSGRQQLHEEAKVGICS